MRILPVVFLLACAPTPSPPETPVTLVGALDPAGPRAGPQPQGLLRVTVTGGARPARLAVTFTAPEALTFGAPTQGRRVSGALEGAQAGTVVLETDLQGVYTGPVVARDRPDAPRTVTLSRLALATPGGALVVTPATLGAP